MSEKNQVMGCKKSASVTQPRFHDLRTEPDKVPELSMWQAKFPQLGDVAEAASSITGHVLDRPEGLRGFLVLWASGLGLFHAIRIMSKHPSARH
jgi:hypothetical protein